MPAFKLNVAKINGCPPPVRVAELMNLYCCPETEEFGVISCSSGAMSVFGTIVRKTAVHLTSLDHKVKVVVPKTIEKATTIQFGIWPASARLEVYTGPGKSVQMVADFLSACLALPVLVDDVDLDVPKAIDTLSQNTKNFQLRSVKIGNYSHNSFMVGSYGPKFLDSEHGKEFLEEHVEDIVSSQVKFAGPTGKVSVTLRRLANIGYSCKEDDALGVKDILSRMIGATA